MYVNELLNKPRFSNGAVRTAWAIRRWPATQQDSLAIGRWMVMEQNATFYTSFTYGSNFIRLIHTYIECTFKRFFDICEIWKDIMYFVNAFNINNLFQTFIRLWHH